MNLEGYEYAECPNCCFDIMVPGHCPRCDAFVMSDEDRAFVRKAARAPEETA